MPRTKINYRSDQIEEVYSDAHWDILKKKREHAQRICGKLNKRGLPLLVYGSLARGDVHDESDLDILINAFISPFNVEMALSVSNIMVSAREIVQATPNDVIKGHIFLQDEACITFFLSRGNKLNYDFYRFGGSVNFEELNEDKRVAGVDKSLTLIIPTEKGHKAVNLEGNEKLAQDLLNISPKILQVRKRVLTKRDKVGRTGVFLSEPVGPEESFGEVLKSLADSNSLIKRKLDQ